VLVLVDLHLLSRASTTADQSEAAFHRLAVHRQCGGASALVSKKTPHVVLRSPAPIKKIVRGVVASLEPEKKSLRTLCGGQGQKNRAWCCGFSGARKKIAPHFVRRPKKNRRKKALSWASTASFPACGLRCERPWCSSEAVFYSRPAAAAGASQRPAERGGGRGALPPQAPNAKINAQRPTKPSFLLYKKAFLHLHLHGLVSRGVWFGPGRGQPGGFGCTGWHGLKATETENGGRSELPSASAPFRATHALLTPEHAHFLPHIT
jgi:hypothetical protein